jgi:hypothetical protein
MGARAATPPEPAEPMFTPPADWPDWIKATARSVEETARHVVSSFQQPVAPFDAPEAETAKPAASAPAAPATRATQGPDTSAGASASEDAPKRTITFVPKGTDASTPSIGEASATDSPAAADATAETPATTTQLTDQDEAERLRILEAVERGEIDIDEALARMDRGSAGPS